ncbi:ROK family protein [Aliivibrio fischeri]|nr:ROK family protein [Aliivibrio fischeri]MCE7579227.1 ROK family protein [Aliivibrio fischeri]MCE7591471.1 ROK family protein [Aliivibrio fischeri]
MATYISFDIGGTDIKFGVLNEQGKVLEQGKVKTETCGEKIIATLVDIKEQWSKSIRSMVQLSLFLDL